MKRLAARLIHSYAAQRVVMAVLNFGAMITGARLLPPDVFAVLLQVAFLAKFLQIANLGAASGYFVGRYSGAGPLATATLPAEARFVQSYGLHLVAITCVLLAGAVWLAPVYLPGLAGFALFIPLFITEPLFRYRRRFYFSLLPDLFLALAMWGVIAAWQAGMAQDRALIAVYYVLLAGLVAALIMLVVRRISASAARDVSDGTRPFGPRAYGRILRLGMPVYLGTALFTLASSADRLFLPLHVSPADLNLYFLAYQLTVGAMLFVTSMNFVNAVDLGQARQGGADLSVALLWRKLWQAALVLLASLAILTLGVYVLEGYILGPDYARLMQITLTLAGGLGLFFLAGTVTPVLAYLHRQVPMTWAMGVVACTTFASNMAAYAYGYGIFWLAGVTAAGFSIYAAVAIVHTFRAVRAYAAAPP